MTPADASGFIIQSTNAGTFKSEGPILKVFSIIMVKDKLKKTHLFFKRFFFTAMSLAKNRSNLKVSKIAALFTLTTRSSKNLLLSINMAGNNEVFADTTQFVNR